VSCAGSHAAAVLSPGGARYRSNDGAAIRKTRRAGAIAVQYCRSCSCSCGLRCLRLERFNPKHSETLHPFYSRPVLLAYHALSHTTPRDKMRRVFMLSTTCTDSRVGLVTLCSEQRSRSYSNILTSTAACPSWQCHACAGKPMQRASASLETATNKASWLPCGVGLVVLPHGAICLLVVKCVRHALHHHHP
jgi:hypothetical protein